MGSIYRPFFMRKLLYGDLILLFGYSLKVEKLKDCVCTCMFGFLRSFMSYHWDIYRGFTTENCACCWTLSNLKYMKEKLYPV